MFIEPNPPKKLFAPEERDIQVRDSTLRSYGAKTYFRQQSAINIWPRCGQGLGMINCESFSDTVFEEPLAWRLLKTV